MTEPIIAEGQVNSGEGPKENVDINALVERLKLLESTNARLLDESKKSKEKYQTANSLIEQAERERLEKEGNFQGLLEQERKRSEKLELENKGVKQKVLRSNIQSTILKFAGEVHSLDDVLNQPSFSHILNKGINSDELTLSEESAKEYLNALFTEKPYLKKASSNTQVITSKPSYQNGDGAIKPIGELTKDEIEKLLSDKFK